MYGMHLGPDLGVCKKLNGIEPPQGMGLKKKFIAQWYY